MREGAKLEEMGGIERLESALRAFRAGEVVRPRGLRPSGWPGAAGQPAAPGGLGSGGGLRSSGSGSPGDSGALGGPAALAISGRWGSWRRTSAAAESERRSVEVETVYRVRVDGRPVEICISAHGDGRVSCELLPYATYASALDLVQALLAGPAGPPDLRDSRAQLEREARADRNRAAGRANRPAMPDALAVPLPEGVR